MAILNPCCCITLRTGAKTVAAIDIVVAVILLIIFLTDLILTIADNGKAEITTPLPLSSSTDTTTEIDYNCEEEDELSVASVSGSYVTSGVWTILTVFFATNVGISALLYTGARNYSIRRCKWWFYIQTVITSVAFLVLILIICFQVSFGLLVLDLLHLLYRFYTLWVVYLFIAELTYLDTLCSLNHNKKGAGMMYNGQLPFPSMYTPYSHTTPYHSYAHHQQQQYQQYMDSGSGSGVSPVPISSIGPPHYSSDDGLPGTIGNGGIDNPTYLP